MIPSRSVLALTSRLHALLSVCDFIHDSCSPHTAGAEPRPQVANFLPGMFWNSLEQETSLKGSMTKGCKMKAFRGVSHEIRTCLIFRQNMWKVLITAGLSKLVIVCGLWVLLVGPTCYGSQKPSPCMACPLGIYLWQVNIS